MARTLRDQKLDTPNARRGLKVRREPYWRSITEGTAIGYRPSQKRPKAGTWIAKHYIPATGRRYKALGAADDNEAANGSTILSFAQAQEQARAWFERSCPAAETDPGMTVKRAGAAYVEFLEAERKTAHDTKKRLEKHVYPTLGEKVINDLTTAELNRLKRGMVRKDPTSPDPEEDERRSKDSANRVLTMIKAALNRAFNDPENKIKSDAAWRRVKPFHDVGRAREVHLDVPESNRLINACDGAFRRLVTAALLTGARAPHELVRLRVRHFRADLGILSITGGKTGRRNIVLTAEAIDFFTGITAGRAADALLLPKDDGEVWGKNHHVRPMAEAVKRAKLTDEFTIYCSRHTHASQAILAGMNLKLLAENMGTSIRMLEKHYGKFIAASRQKLVEESGFRLGLPPSKVTKIA